MTTLDDLKNAAHREIESNADKILNICSTILDNPEPGFREIKTGKTVNEVFSSMGVPFKTGLALTGSRAEITFKNPGPTVAILGELDSLIVKEHPFSDPKTGAAHACGQHCQIGMMLAAGMALNTDIMQDELCGRIILMAVPAEEYIEIEYRDTLRALGKLEFLGGKPEFIRLGEFDDVDIAMMMHTTSDPEEKQICISGTNNGTVAKRIKFIGKGAHAGGAPHLGINALNAASLALSAIHYNRETFRDNDTIRVHPIITKGGEAVSAVPSEVTMETFIRGKTMEAIMDANAKVDRALRAGALAVGAQVNIKTIPGYMPLSQDPNLMDILKENATYLVGEENIGRRIHGTGSTDMGDVSQIMPIVHPYVGGATGIGHGATYVIEDYQLAVLTAAKTLASTAIDLLSNSARLGNEVLGKHRPNMTSAEYLSYMRNLNSDTTYDS